MFISLFHKLPEIKLSLSMFSIIKLLKELLRNMRVIMSEGIGILNIKLKMAIQTSIISEISLA